MGVNVVRDNLARHSIRAFLQRIHCAAASQPIRKSHQLFFQSSQPARSRLTVVIGEGKKSSGGGSRSQISRAGRTSIVVSNQPDVDFTGEGCDDRVKFT